MKKIRDIFLLLLILFSFLSFKIKFEPIDITNPEDISNNKISKKQSVPISAWIIIGGDRYDHNKVERVKKTCNRTYEILRKRGYLSDQIYYLAPNKTPSQPYVNATSNFTNVQSAFLDWASTKINEISGLGIYLHDHGNVDLNGVGKLCLPGNPDLFDWHLDGWLNVLEASTGCNRFLIIVEACHSGAFIDPVSKENRIVITSANITGKAAGTPACYPLFSSKFWGDILAGKTVGKAFEGGVFNIYEFGYEKLQVPWIDDDHNEIGHNITPPYGALPTGGDGFDALLTKIGLDYGAYQIPVFLGAPLNLWGNKSLRRFDLWAQIQNSTPLEHVYMRVIPPGWQPPPIPDHPEGTLGFYINDGTFHVEMDDTNGDGNYTITWTIPPREFPDWPEEGKYKVNLIATDNEGGVADTVTTSVTFNENASAPPDTTPPTVGIKNPKPNSHVSGLINITVKGDDDQALANISIYIDGELVKTQRS
ncbi:MAG: C13 family peptidase, partial [Promethearchaeota archaeon]